MRAEVTVTIVDCVPPVTGSPSERAANATPDCWPVNASAAWLLTAVPEGCGAFTVTRKTTLVVTATSMRPPAAAVAPVPRRATTLREAPTYSA